MLPLVGLCLTVVEPRGEPTSTSSNAHNPAPPGTRCARRDSPTRGALRPKSPYLRYARRSRLEQIARLMLPRPPLFSRAPSDSRCGHQPDRIAAALATRGIIIPVPCRRHADTTGSTWRAAARRCGQDAARLDGVKGRASRGRWPRARPRARQPEPQEPVGAGDQRAVEARLHDVRKHSGLEETAIPTPNRAHLPDDWCVLPHRPFFVRRKRFRALIHQTSAVTRRIGLISAQRGESQRWGGGGRWRGREILDSRDAPLPRVKVPPNRANGGHVSFQRS